MLCLFLFISFSFYNLGWINNNKWKKIILSLFFHFPFKIKITIITQRPKRILFKPSSNWKKKKKNDKEKLKKKKLTKKKRSTMTQSLQEEKKTNKSFHLHIPKFSTWMARWKQPVQYCFVTSKTQWGLVTNLGESHGYIKQRN